jgi:hypothetical protein
LRDGLNANDDGAGLARDAPKRIQPERRCGRIEGDEDALTGTMVAATEEANAPTGDVKGHGFFGPRNIFRADMHGKGDAAANAMAAVGLGGLTICTRSGTRFGIEGNTDSSYRPGSDIAVGAWGQVFFLWVDASDAGQNFGLTSGEVWIIGKGNPDRNASCMRAIRGNE